MILKLRALPLLIAQLYFYKVILESQLLLFFARCNWISYGQLYLSVAVKCQNFTFNKKS